MRELYQLTFPNGKKYIGISTDAKRRFIAHKCGAAAGKSGPLRNAIRKYGADSVSLQVLAIGHDDYIAEMEIKAIEAFNTRDIKFGYNVAVGGDLGAMAQRSHTDKSKAKMSLSQKSRVRSEEELARMPVIAKRRIITPEYREKLRKAALRRWTEPSFRQAQSDRMKGNRPSAETLAAASKAKQTDEFRSAQSERMKKYYAEHPEKKRGKAKPISTKD